MLGALSQEILRCVAGHEIAGKEGGGEKKRAIYVIEAKAQFAPAAERVEHRKETGPLLDAFFAWADATVVKLSAKSALAEAFRYTIKRRKVLSASSPTDVSRLGKSPGVARLR